MQQALVKALLVLWLLALTISAHAATVRPRVLLKEDFETYINTEELRVVWKNSTAELEFSPPGGGKAASHPGDKIARRGRFTILPDEGHHILFSADFYDFATNFHKHVSVFLQNTNGEFLQMGFQGASLYVLRIFGFGTTTNWVPFNKAQLAVEGWHRFKAEMSMTNLVATLDLGADGKVDYTLNLPVTMPQSPFTHVRFGSLAKQPSSGGPVLVDNIRVEVIRAVAQAEVAQKGQESAPLLAKPPMTNANPIARSDRQKLVTTNLSGVGNTNRPAALSSMDTSRAFVTSQQVAWWIFGALAVIGVLLTVLLVMLKRSTAPAHALVRIPKRPLELAENVAEGDSPDEDWRRRALAAEALATRQAQVLGEKIGPELTEFAKEALVQGLYGQRNALLESERRALLALAELEDRLAELQLARPDRIEAYQKRIGELEKMLETRDEEMRELTKATLRLVREKLEQEREGVGPRLN